MILRRHASVPIARRQLAARRGRTIAGIAGIATALLLILAFRAIFAGIESRLTAYIDGTGADVIVAQQGVRIMHMTQSALPLAVATQVASVPGVAASDPVLVKGGFVEATSGRNGIVTLVGGGPVPELVAGRVPAPGEIVLDRSLARTLDAGVGDRVRVLGADLIVSGEVTGTASLTGSFAFLARQTLASILRAGNVTTYVLVRAAGSLADDELAERIEAAVPGVTATPRRAFAASERSVVGDMSTDIVRGMIVVGFVIGVAVAALVAYAQTLGQLRDYGLLRALGLRGWRAIALVLAQVVGQVAVGFAIALSLLLALSALAPSVSPTLALAVRTGDVLEAAGVAATVAVAAALVPVSRVLRVDPASVYRSTS